MLNRPEGGFEWLKDHNSRFEHSKFAVLDFSMNSMKEHPPMNIKGTVISPGRTHRFLGGKGPPTFSSYVAFPPPLKAFLSP
ncbi:hypothetical protein PAXRUDRAFT_19372 [Paxillus rubicundulus Ve08.2h10]|uniref:Uncharacterized protein n=1 Tax=Paxillus rubicundulus Ve08.2h10 TaxID=930991 RepID=A0A0D0D4T6_9AGAM|nr:hypothetical protein PAXRUDRAFT_19372 [Paxillus rubicundulus Ve08.2h10]